MKFPYRFPYELVDLTHTLTGQVPTLNGGGGFNHDMNMDYADCQGEDKFRVMELSQGEDKFRVMELSMSAGIGTHMDAPSHCSEGGR